MNLPYDLETMQLMMPPMRLETIRGGSASQESLARPGQLQ